jgi:hypothetical protein
VWLCVYNIRYSKFSVSQRENPLLPPPSALPQLLFRWSDWLGVDLEVRSLCYRPQPLIGNQRIEECLHSNFGRILISPLDVIRTILISYQVFLFFLAGGDALVRPPAMPWRVIKIYLRGLIKTTELETLIFRSVILKSNIVLHGCEFTHCAVWIFKSELKLSQP